MVDFWGWCFVVLEWFRLSLGCCVFVFVMGVMFGGGGDGCFLVGVFYCYFWYWFGYDYFVDYCNWFGGSIVYGCSVY